MFLFLLAVAGSETTRTAISHGVLTLHEHPSNGKNSAATRA
jgi:cytochrome P450